MSSDNKEKISDWLDVNLPKYERLKKSSQNILENLLTHEKVDYLSVSGRVKGKKSCLEKLDRKGYSSIEKQMTDLSGIRVIVYFESDLDKVGKIIRKAFNVDEENSEDKVDSLDKDKLGYRSVHYVCELGGQRCSLPEFSGLNGMRFEIQARTVLQHAWAELAHDRGYKFSNALPLKLERKLNLYAGLLELADNGFDELTKEIEEYKNNLEIKENLDDVKIDSISLVSFLKKWTKENALELADVDDINLHIDDLVKELNMLNIFYIKDLKDIIPDQAKELAEDLYNGATIFGLIRSWLIVYDYKGLADQLDVNWYLTSEQVEVFEKYVGVEKAEEIRNSFNVYNP